MLIYLAGPMRNIKDFNFPAFFDAQYALEAQGHKVYNPAHRDVTRCGLATFQSETGDLKDIKSGFFSLRDAMAHGLKYICEHAEAIVLLPGWEKSKGACAEKAVAEALGLQVLYY